jgi:DNA-binding XRE family transcriptional regulator
MTKPKYVMNIGELEAYRNKLGYTQAQMGALMSMTRANYARIECGSYGMRKYHFRLLRMIRILERAGLLEEFAKECFKESGIALGD